jgi:hypothetical protein
MKHKHCFSFPSSHLVEDGYLSSLSFPQISNEDACYHVESIDATQPLLLGETVFMPEPDLHGIYIAAFNI